MQLLAFALVIGCVANTCDEEYNRFLARFPDKEASSYRKNVFCRRLEHIQTRNSDANGRFTLGVNQFSDLTKDEFRTMLGGHPLDYGSPLVNDSLFKPNGLSAPLGSVDWRASMPPIKDQGSCGSCWAFAAVAVVDFQAGGSHSEQQLLDCSGHACGGWHSFDALRYLQDKGSDAESEYPYTGTNGSCRQDGLRARATVSNVQSVDGEDDIAAVASTRVVAVSINAGSFDDFQSYSSGVYESDCGDSSFGHAVAVVGYTQDYWIIRNSWGTGWGLNGYMYFKRGSNLCNIGHRGAATATAVSSGSGSTFVV